MNDGIVYIGADVGKDTIHWQIGGRPLTTLSTPSGIAKGLSQVARLAGETRVVCEASGGYERVLLKACWKRGQPVCLVSGDRVRHHALSNGVRAKSDDLDARMILDYAENKRPAPIAQPTPEQSRMRELSDTRTQLVGAAQKLKVQMDQTDDAFASKALAAVIRAVERQIEALDQQIRALVTSQSAWTAKVHRFMEVKGVGWITACAMIAYMPELGTLEENKAAGLAGLAPHPEDSGNQHGKRMIQGGRWAVRRALYMAALTAIRHNPVFKEVYLRMRTRGKPKKVAIVAIMRRMIELLNHMLKKPTLVLAK